MLTPEETRRQLEESMMNMRANEEHFEMAANNIARLFYQRYMALQEAGFTEQQAFEIVKTRGLE